MCPKNSPLATRRRASAFNAAAMSVPIRPEATSESALKSTQLGSMNPGLDVST